MRTHAIDTDEDASNHSIPPAAIPAADNENGPPLAPLCEVERRYIERVLTFTGGRKLRAARMLGITRWSLNRRLRKHGLLFVSVLAIASMLATPVHAGRVPGGGNPRSDCYAQFEVAGATTASAQQVDCVDGAACDQDGTCNGSCTFGVAICLNQNDGDQRCTAPASLEQVEVRNLTLDVPPLAGSACGAFVDVKVDLRHGGRRAGRAKLPLVAVGPDRPRRDRDRLVLRCLPSPTGCQEAPASSCVNASGGPSELVYTVAAEGTDLDIGFSGVSHSFPIVAGATLRMCLSGCDQRTNPVCTASGATGEGSLNGSTFGPPLPLFAGGVPACVVNQFAEPTIQATVNLETGAYESTVGGTPTPIRLDSAVYTTSAHQVCPQCVSNHCDSGPNAGRACEVEGQVRVRSPQLNIEELYTLSSSCPPGGSQGARAGVIPIDLPVSTGSASVTGSRVCPGQAKDDSCAVFGATCSVACDAEPDPKGGINQWCCSDADHVPCFPTANGSGDPSHAIVRTGAPVVASPAWPNTTYPKVGEGTKLGAVFCIDSTASAVLDQVSGLPGPGAMILNGTQQLLR